MPDPTISTRVELVRKIETSWNDLLALLAHLTEREMTEIRDEQGWTVKDHITHIAAWEDSVAILFRGKPRHEALGVDEALFASGSGDEINAQVKVRRQDVPFASALTELRDIHRRLMASVATLSDTQLNRRVNEFFAETAPSDDRRVIDTVYDNTARHYSEHLTWIRALVSRG